MIDKIVLTCLGFALILWICGNIVVQAEPPPSLIQAPCPNWEVVYSPDLKQEPIGVICR